MKKITVCGGAPLCGEIDVSGSKNAALPIIFACILTKGVSEIKNLPDIGDVRVALDLLCSFGAKVSFASGVAYIDTTSLSYVKPDSFLVSKIRASTYLLGACLSRFGCCHILNFGGCNFSLRPIDMHIDACLSLGGRLFDDQVFADRLIGNKIVFRKTSVGATVNAILLAVAADGETIIQGGAIEPHIDALIDFLISCGADIERHGNVFYINGRELHGGKITVIGDMIEAGTYLAAGIMTNGIVRVNKCPTSDMDSIFAALSGLGAGLEISDDVVVAHPPDNALYLSILATSYPGFPTDLQPIFAPLMAINRGGSIIDTVWNTRFGYLSSLSSFGIEYELKNNCAKIMPSTIFSGEAICPDLRGGMACLLTALIAKGESVIYSADSILRGYEKLENKFSALGADIFIEEM